MAELPTEQNVQLTDEQRQAYERHVERRREAYRQHQLDTYRNHLVSNITRRIAPQPSFKSRAFMFVSAKAVIAACFFHRYDEAQA